MQAVVKIGSSQYLVTPGQEILVSHQAGSPDTLSFSEVLLVIDGDKVQVGQPTVPGVNIKAKVLGEVKGEKVRVSTFKAKSRFRKTIGFRPLYTKIKIDAISSASEAPTEGVKVKRVKKT